MKIIINLFKHSWKCLFLKILNSIVNDKMLIITSFILIIIDKNSEKGTIFN